MSYYELCCNVLRTFEAVSPDEADMLNNRDIDVWLELSSIDSSEARALRTLSRFYHDELISKEARK